MFSTLMDHDSKGLKTWFRQTICEVHRQIYDTLVVELAETRPDVIVKLVPLIDEAYLMGVKMNKKLVENKLSKMKDNGFQSPQRAAQAQATRKERIRLVKLLEQNNQTLKEAGEPTQ